MRKLWVMTLLAVSLGASLPMQAATKPIEVIYNGTTMSLNQAPVIRYGKVWLPIRAIVENMDYAVRYEKNENMVYLSGAHIGEIGIEVVKAGSERDDGNLPILLDGSVYLAIRDLGSSLKKDVQYEPTTKTVSISSLVTMDATLEETPVGKLKYNTETGDFYNGKMLIANLPFTYLDWLGADKQKTAHGNVLYTLYNSYGEPHINDELYSVYAVNGGLHIAKSFKWNANGSNSLIQGDQVALIDQNILSVYDDTTGDLIKRHTISTKPLKDYITAHYNAEYVEELFNDASIGYMVEAVGDDFVLYRNYFLKTLTLVNLKTDQEIELYQKVCTAEEISALETGIREEGDYLKFVKAEKGVIYLKHAYTDQTYAYQYK